MIGQAELDQGFDCSEESEVWAVGNGEVEGVLRL